MKHLLLDIDGVFNPFLCPNLTERGFILYQSGWITWSIDLINHASWLRNVENDVNIVWVSSWLEDSNHLSAMFGLYNALLPHVELSRTGKGDTWKLDSVKEWVKNNTSPEDTIVWIDDEVYSDAFEWADRNNNILIIKTDPAIGLTEDEWQRMLDYR